MNLEKITELKSEVERKFNELESRKNALQAELKETEIEQVRLQGEFRLLKKIGEISKVQEEKPIENK